jgi:uncharacterized protein YcfJ
MKLRKLFTMAFIALCLTSCGPSGKRGAAIGGLLGAGAGAIIGHQSGRGLEGAAIGGAVGAGTGGLLGGARDDDRRAHEERHRWENKRAREDRNLRRAEDKFRKRDRR